MLKLSVPPEGPTLGILQRRFIAPYTLCQEWTGSQHGKRAGSESGVYDAFGRTVEWMSGSAATQAVYAPEGAKFAFMNGSTLVRYIDPMVAGTAAIHPLVGPGYYQHADWLGSSRLGVTGGSGNVWYDRQYAPFGEVYDESGTTNRDFTGHTEDTTAGIDDFPFRQYSPTQGRWLVPDPAGLA
ncbi:MAG TPA: RHS repeat-associated core domain-containing protein, partial [Candidatus Binatia bacterium]|nr:RHS repeat-associated core domain-containing protein [Candidatus Binatia bacterium]